jgi:EAL domain-containing protein (putative c-di-GMP-specific phosphodiesterase class I)
MTRARAVGRVTGTSVASASDVAAAAEHRPVGGARPLGRVEADHRVLDRILAKNQLRSVYQPIIDLQSGVVAGFEALARGPRGSSLESPDALFDAARRAGRLNEVEWACRAAAIEGALAADIGTQLTLFINVEPKVLGSGIPPQLEQLFRTASRKLRIVLELTERDLTRHPAELLSLVAWARSQWWGVALDDVGAEEESLALLPLVAPDVVKLDMRLLHGPASPEDDAVIEAVQDHAARTGAAVLAEGIENDQHLEAAHRLGATLGQGWHYGFPGEIGSPPTRRVAPVRLLPPPDRRRTVTPFSLLHDADDAVDRVDADVLAKALDDIEHRAARLGRPSILVACIGDDAAAIPALADRYARLAEHCTFVGIAGVGMPAVPAPGVKGIAVPERHAMARERAVVLIGPNVACAAAGRPVTGRGDLVEGWELLATDDRDAVLPVAKLLMSETFPGAGRA